MDRSGSNRLTGTAWSAYLRDSSMRILAIGAPGRTLDADAQYRRKGDAAHAGTGRRRGIGGEPMEHAIVAHPVADVNRNRRSRGARWSSGPRSDSLR